MEITVETLKDLYPDVYAAVVKDATDAGYVDGYGKGKEEGKAAGADAERERIKGIETVALPGHEALVAEMKLDGKTTGAEAAIRIIEAEKAKKAVKLEAYAAEHITVVSTVDASIQAAKESKEKEEQKEINANLPLDMRCKAEWEKNPQLRAEFGNSFDAYLAYSTHADAGSVKILGSKIKEA
jgi:hypothetical protein